MSRRGTRRSPQGARRPPPGVHEWSCRHTTTVDAEAVRRAAIEPSPLARRPSGALDRRAGVIPGGSAEARAIYPRLFWATNDSDRPAVDWHAYPLDIVVVERQRAPRQFFVDDPDYRATARRYRLLSQSCIVCDPNGSIMNVFVTSDDMPSLGPLATQARAALARAKTDLVPRHSFAVGGDYARDPAYRDKLAAMHVRMAGTIWNDGLQTYTSATPGWGGMYFTQYFRRRPATDLTAFALPYVGMYNVERAVVPAVADARATLLRRARLPCAFPGLPCAAMPATQVGISEDFAVKTHADSCISSVTETIFWANRGVRGARFAVTSLEIAFDIGSRPCILFQKGNEMHGTVPGPKGSCGLVLISKRNTLQQFERGAYTDRTG